MNRIDGLSWYLNIHGHDHSNMELIANYRNKVETMDIALVEEDAEYFKNADKMMDMIQMEVL